MPEQEASASIGFLSCARPDSGPDQGSHIGSTRRRVVAIPRTSRDLRNGVQRFVTAFRASPPHHAVMVQTYGLVLARERPVQAMKRAAAGISVGPGLRVASNMRRKARAGTPQFSGAGSNRAATARSH